MPPRVSMSKTTHPQRCPPFATVTKRSVIDGQGLFVLEVIPARSKIGEFKGQAITRREARRRASKSDRIAIVELSESRAIDASVGGNEFRFINHSCTPNAFMRRCYGRVEFYALREIQIGEELTCDYGETHHNRTKQCKCSSSNCRGWI
jgi:SET domain-containing protein